MNYITFFCILRIALTLLDLMIGYLIILPGSILLCLLTQESHSNIKARYELDNYLDLDARLNYIKYGRLK